MHLLHSRTDTLPVDYATVTCGKWLIRRDRIPILQSPLHHHYLRLPAWAAHPAPYRIGPRLRLGDALHGGRLLQRADRAIRI